MSTFAERIESALEHADMTAYSLSKQVGWSANYVSRLIKHAHDETAQVAADKLFRMALILGVRHEWLLFGSGAMLEEDEAKRRKALLHPLDLAVEFLGPSITTSAVVAVESWAKRHDPDGWKPVAWARLLMEAQRQLNEGREPALPPPGELEGVSRDLVPQLSVGDSDPPAKTG